VSTRDHPRRRAADRAYRPGGATRLSGVGAAPASVGLVPGRIQMGAVRIPGVDEEADLPADERLRRSRGSEVHAAGTGVAALDPSDEHLARLHVDALERACLTLR